MAYPKLTLNKLSEAQALRVVIAVVGSQKDLAKALTKRGYDITAAAVTGWVRTGMCPPKYALVLEDLSLGTVTRYDLRPDIYGEKGKD